MLNCLLIRNQHLFESEVMIYFCIKYSPFSLKSAPAPSHVPCPASLPLSPRPRVPPISPVSSAPSSGSSQWLVRLSTWQHRKHGKHNIKYPNNIHDFDGDINLLIQFVTLRSEDIQAMNIWWKVEGSIKLKSFAQRQRKKNDFKSFLGGLVHHFLHQVLKLLNKTKSWRR